ncbi:MAG: hypothetical protein JSU94_03940 [Phycisphaerales bacterium]|nr:MAG: hypothetical protein JSU94_03940 [Phycisphaerales bacterium]
MKKLGFLVMTIGFVAAALAAVMDEKAVGWVYFGPALAVSIAGVVLARVGHRRAAKSEGRLAANIELAETALGRVVENITSLNREKNSIETYEVRHRLDAVFPDDLAQFVGARESIAHVYGLNSYGEVMSSFAAGERYLNRVWSASADGYVDEVNAYLAKAREQFTESLEKVRGLKAERGTKS